MKADCKRCHKTFEPEQVEFDGFKIANDRFCDECADLVRLEYDESEKAEAEEKRKDAALAKFNFLLPGEFRGTDKNHPGINNAAFEESLLWYPRKFNNQSSLILHGATRLGKSRSLWGLFKALSVNRGHKCHIYEPMQLQSEFVQSYSDHRSDAFANQIKYMEVLMIDDLFKETKGGGKLSPNYESFIFGILDHRFSRSKPTIFTTNDVGKTTLSKFNDEDRAIPMILRFQEFCHTVAF